AAMIQLAKTSAAVVCCACFLSAWAEHDAGLDAALPALVMKYQAIHSSPELSHYEERTAKTITAELRKLGFEVTEGVGKYENPKWTCHGVVGVFKNGAGNTLLLRTELDALPIVEQTGTDYASNVSV